MKLYLIADGHDVSERWMKVFIEQDHQVLSSLPNPIPPQSIMFILDSVVSNLDEKSLIKLFENRVMVLSTVPTFADAQKFLKYGAMGYGNAMMHESHLHSAYQALEEGKVWLHPDFIGMMISQIRDTSAVPEEKSVQHLETLSKREQEVAIMLGNGATHQEIADTLDITVRTVKAHASAIYQKLDVKDRLALSLLLHS